MNLTHFLFNSFVLHVLLAFRAVFTHLNISTTELNHVTDYESTNNKLTAIVGILVRRNIVRFSFVIDPDAVIYCESFALALHEATKSCLRVYNSDWNYAENPFSKVNILCFGRDENFVSFAARTQAFVSADAFNIILMREEPQLEGMRALLQSENYHIWPHSILIHDGLVKGLHPSHVTELTIDEKTTVRDIFGVSNFHGRSLRVTQFARIPEVTPTRTGFIGSSYNIMMTLAKCLNFTPIVTNTTDGERFGDFVNGTFTGALGDIVYNRTDLVLNGNFLQEPQSDIYWYTVPVNFEQVCVTLPQAEKIPKYLTPFLCLSPNVWLVLKITFITVCCVHYVCARLGYVYLNFDKNSIGNSVLTTLSATINIPLTVPRYKYPSVRVLLIVYLSYMYVLVSAFRASLVTSLTVPMHYADIDSLDDLKESGKMKDLWTFSKSILKSFRRTELKDDPILSEMNRNVKFIEPTGPSLQHEDKGFLSRSLYSHARVLHDFVFEIGNKSAAFHRVKECPMSYYVAYLLPKKFPFVEEINAVITRTIESGLIAKWDSEIIDYSMTDKFARFRLRLVPPRGQVLNFESQPKKFSLEHLQIAFYILLAGWSMSVCAFLTEIAVGGKERSVAKPAQNIRGRKFCRQKRARQ